MNDAIGWVEIAAGFSLWQGNLLASALWLLTPTLAAPSACAEA